MPEIDTNKNISYQSDSITQIEIGDLIGNPPGWLLRSGIMMVAIVTGVIIAVAYYFNYPDKLIGSGTLTSTTPPIEIVSRATGYIEKIHIKEEEFVTKGEAILYISNTTDKTQLTALQKWIEKYEMISDPNKYLNLDFMKGLQLGGVQGDYAGLQLKYNEFQQTLKDDIVFKQINNISSEISKIKILNKSQQKEKEIYEKELDLTNKDYKRNENLNNSGVVSDFDLEKVKTSLLQKERLYEGMNNIIIQNNIRIGQLELEKLKLSEQRSNAIKEYQFTIAEVIARIKASVTTWTNAYTVIAPISGKMIYALNINEQKNLKQEESIGYIIPKNANKKYISALYPIGNIGNIEKGQKVILKFDAYPHKEFGSVISKVESISIIPILNKNDIAVYEVKIPVRDVIITDYGDTIRSKPNMTVRAEIITKSMTVFQRIFNQFLSLVNQQNI